jgi:hypothetical protein
MKDKEALFKKFVNNPTYTSTILQTINEHDFVKQSLVLMVEDEIFVLVQKGNDIKVKK